MCALIRCVLKTVEDKEDVWTEVAYGEQLFSGRLGEGQKDIDRNISNRYYNQCIILYDNIIQILTFYKRKTLKIFSIPELDPSVNKPVFS